VPVLTEKIHRTDALGEKIGNDFHDKINGFIPVQASYKQLGFMKDLLLLGKLVFFENGFIYVDTRLNAFMILYEDIQEVNFYQDNSAYIQWMEVIVAPEALARFPANMFVQRRLLLKISHNFFVAKYKQF